jgi:uncharacterized protein
MVTKREGQVGQRFLIYFLGLLIMSLGIVLLIKCNLGATPWDVLHVGLYYQIGLTVGSWSILVGILILGIAAIIAKEIPQIGAFMNMVLVGVFIDFYLMLPFMQTPSMIAGKIGMFIVGMILSGYGMGIYISAGFGTGPRDSLMMALTARTKWKVRDVRVVMEIVVLLVGWQLGGPVFWGTVVISLSLGPIVGFALPQSCQFTDWLLEKLNNKTRIILPVEGNDSNRGADV